MKAPVLPSRLSPEEAALDARMERWRKTAITFQPTANGEYVRTVCSEIVRRAQILSQHYPIRFNDVAVFFLERTEAWVMAGLPINAIGLKLPKNLKDLGIMKMAEGSDQLLGMPLTTEELKAVSEATKKKLQ
jgi:hypothetical protein